METLILKIILSSLFLISFYYLVLEKEKIFLFNRFFLLFSLAFSYFVPLISLEIPGFSKQRQQLIFEENLQQILIKPQNPQIQTFNWQNLILLIYVIGVIFLLIKSIISVFKILNLKGKTFKINQQKIRILDDEVSPFSFWDTIYLGKKYFENNKIDERILLHEKIHIIQKHSFDLIYIEIFKIFSWFNPALYFYKKAMITNHEFLADQNVLKENFEIKPYQNLILNELETRQNIDFAHQFNYNNTKKRFIMMTTKTSKNSGIKKFFTIPLFTILFVLFVQKTYAENTASETNISPQKSQAYPSVAQGNMVLKNLPGKQNSEKSNLDEMTEKKVQDTAKEVAKIETTLDGTPIIDRDEEIIPEFPGGMNAFRSKIASIFDASVFGNQKGTLRSVVHFIIDTNGKTKNYSVEGDHEAFNREVLRCAQKANENETWKPAMKKGVAVEYNFILPMTMNFTE